MPDILTHLLRLSSEAENLGEFLRGALEVIMAGANASGGAFVRSTAPEWSVEAARGVSRDLPLELAADALQRDDIATSGSWIAIPVVASAHPRAGRQEHALLLHGSRLRGDFKELAIHLANALAIVLNRAQASERVKRLEAVLEIVYDWQQTNEMESLLKQMAEAATRLFQADRASIFLWDKPNKTIVGRPALGVEGGELFLPDDTGIVGQVIQTGEARRASGHFDSDEIDRAVDRQTGYQTDTLLCVPLISPDGEIRGAFELINKRQGSFTVEDERGLTELAAYAAVALENTQQFSDLLERHEQMVAEASQDTLLVGESAAIQSVRSTVGRIASTELAVLLLGENGTGKEVVARSLHFEGHRRKYPFIAVNCAALTETLLESELFGHEKGAFTDAHESRAGKFELASGGTLFLDEIGDMSLSGQAKLLRVLEEKCIVRVGGSKPIHTDVRVIAATNQNLSELVRAKRFREDLYFRLNVVTIELPPLRARGDDIIRLAEHFLREFCRRAGRRVPKFSAAARKRLETHLWPGNVRELRNLMERLAYMSSGDRIEPDELAFILSPGAESPQLIDTGLRLNEATQEFQRLYISRTIDRARGNISQAAKVLGVHRSNLYRKMHQLGMEPGEGEREDERA